MKKNHKIIGVAFTLAMPMFALAQTFESIMTKIRAVLNALVPLLVAVAVILFIWGVVQFIGSGASGDEERRSAGRQLMIWGIVGLFIIVSVWGFVNALLRTLDLDVRIPDIPVLPIF